MPSLEKLSIHQLRNIEGISLEPVPGINILHGANGSGKTSVLEAIHLLGLARSFRSHQLKTLIRHDQDALTVFGRLAGSHTLGISRGQSGPSDIRIDGKPAGSVAALARQLPVQLFNASTFRVLEGSPGDRRSFIDWGVFHVEHRFFPVWRQMQKSLQQRNALLKQEASLPEIAPWSEEFARTGTRIDEWRQTYLNNLLPFVQAILDRLYPVEGLSFSYERGWPAELTLLESLEKSLNRDQRYGHTHAGPHRAELRVSLNGVNAEYVLSRGQLKLIVCGLKIAQGLLLKQVQDMACVYLIDDLPSELDLVNREALAQELQALESQVFVTCVEPDSLSGCWKSGVEKRLFHVKHGKITE